MQNFLAAPDNSPGEDNYPDDLNKVQHGTPLNTPNIFASSRAIIPSCMPLQHAVNGMQNAASGGNRWQQPEGRPPFYTGTSKAGTTIVEYSNNAPIINLWPQVQKFTDLDVDVLLAILAQILSSSESTDKRASWIYAAQVLDYRGIDPIMKADKPGGPKRRAGHRQEDIQDIVQCIDRLSNLWVTVNQFINEEVQTKGKRKKRKQTEYSERSRLINIESVWYQRELIDSPTTVEAQPIGWYVRAGKWLEPFLGEHNRQIGFICQKALEYDPYREQWEKRIARYLFFHIRMNGHVGNLSREIGNLIDTLSLPINTRDPEKTRQRFKKAMDRLKGDGQIDNWEYTEEPTLPARGWLSTWLRQSITIHFASYKSSTTKN